MAFEDIPNAADRFAMYALSRLLRRSTPSRLPSKSDKQPTADVALDEGVAEYRGELASEPSNCGDVPPDASLHSTIHTFRRCLAACCCFVAATDRPPWALLLC